MFDRLANSLIPLLLKAAHKKKSIQIAMGLAIVSPVLLIAVLAYVSTYQALTDAALSRRQSIASLASTVLEQRFERLTDLGVSFATRVRFRQLVSHDQWDAAIEILRDIRKDFPFIDRVFLADPQGTLMSDTPALAEVRGKNFSERDWYRGVSRSWKPYVSNVYRRAAVPRYNVVAAAIPVRTEEGAVAGILVLQVPLNALVGWTKTIDFGSAGFIYVVDRNGRLATHPALPSVGEIVDYSGVPVVQKVLKQQSGVEPMVDPLQKDERVAAYAPIRAIGWGVLATEATQTAFAGRFQALLRLVFFYGFVVLVSSFLAYLILRTGIGLRRAEEKIQTLNSELQQRALGLELANRELESFSYSVSHDLRAPLRTIDGFSQALVEDYGSQLNGEAKDYLGRICAATRRMGRLIDDLLNLSRLTRSQIKVETVDLSALVRAIASELQAAEPGRQVRFAIGDGIFAKGDRRLLRIALENLIRNAWKFTGKRASATIEFGVNGHDGDRAYFVRDNGAGFDMAYSSKLFGAFQRLHPASEFDGTGIGLATVQRIIHRHNGHVWAEAKVDQGATFYFTLDL